MSEHSHETFFLESVLVELEILDCSNITSDKKRQFCRYIFGICKILEHPFSSEHLQKNICSRDFSLWTFISGSSRPVVLKENSTAYVFLDIFQSFQNTLMKSSVTDWLHQRQFLEIFEDEIILTQKKFTIDSYSGNDLQYFQE